MHVVLGLETLHGSHTNFAAMLDIFGEIDALSQRLGHPVTVEVNLITCLRTSSLTASLSLSLTHSISLSHTRIRSSYPSW